MVRHCADDVFYILHATFYTAGLFAVGLHQHSVETKMRHWRWPSGPADDEADERFVPSGQNHQSASRPLLADFMLFSSAVICFDNFIRYFQSFDFQLGPI